MTKICFRCNTEKNTYEFSLCSRNKDKLASYCKCCNKIVAEEYRKNEEVKKQIKETAKVRANKIKQYNKEYYLNRTKDKRKNSPSKVLDSLLRRKYGITIDDYNRMLDEQKDCCALCGIHQSNLSRRLVVDHCHSTGKVRKLLCYPCNTTLGLVKESEEILNKMINYLKLFKDEK